MKNQYRIVKVKHPDGTEYYRVQQKGFLFWCFLNPKFKFIIDADKYIKGLLVGTKITVESAIYK